MCPRRLQATFAAESGSPGSSPAGVGSAPAGVGSAALPSPAVASAALAGPVDEYGRLQRRLLLATLAVSLLVSLGTWLVFGGAPARSVLLGGCCGLLYLRLLARSVGRLGPDSRSLGRFQILVPALLVIGAARLPAIELLPALLGFLLYKPALLLQAFLAP